jgi:hypothetical protein
MTLQVARLKRSTKGTKGNAVGFRRREENEEKPRARSDEDGEGCSEE